MKTLEFLVGEEARGERLDKWLSLQSGQTRSAIEQLCQAGQVTLQGKPLGKNHKLTPGQSICLALPDPKPLDTPAQQIPLQIVYEDEHLLVVNKPKGMVVHPAPGNPDSTLVNALLAHCAGQLSGINGVLRPGIVHRIDKDTSGLLLVAKTDVAHLGLAAQIKAHSLRREYEALVQGKLRQPQGSINAPIGRHPIHRKRMCVRQDGRTAVTHYTTLEQYKGYSHLSLRLETGRTHQIRVHMAHLGHPVAGDTLYGGAGCTGLQGQCLHARSLGFIHPITGEEIYLTSPLPPYFMQLLARLQAGGL